MAEAPAATLRVDKWLFHARFCKSRSLAAHLVGGSKLRVNGTLTTKAHYAVKAGDVLTFALGPRIRVVKILDLGTRRGPAPEAQALYEDMSPPTPPKADAPDVPTPVALRDKGAGRPTKNQRRAIDRLRGELGD